jgi:hypothetical protein
MYCSRAAIPLGLATGRGGLKAKKEGWAGIQLPLPENNIPVVSALILMTWKEAYAVNSDRSSSNRGGSYSLAN